ncbi:MAG: hypothetical protein ABEJ60_05445 [Halodesulfurarchaeum sp.]
MELSGDEIAGILDQFGALPPAALRQAIHETAFRAGVDPEAETVEGWIESAREDLSILTVEIEGEALYAPGPRAFPRVPEAASDLPHVLEAPRRQVPAEALESGLRERLEAAVDGGADPDRARELLDLTYDAEAWAGIDLADLRDRLRDVATEGES